MVRRELIFFGTLISWMILIILGILLCPITLGKSGYLFNLIPIFVLFISIIPRYFSTKYNKWLETDPFKKNK